MTNDNLLGGIDIMKFCKVTFQLTVALICLNMVIVGCDYTKGQDSLSKKVTVNIDGEPEVLDPQLATDLNSMRIINAVFEGLCRFDENGVPMPGIARTWEISEDKLTYTFNLRDALWSDGTQVTAMDFKEAWLRALDPKQKDHQSAQFGYLLKCIDGAESYLYGEGSKEDVAIVAKDEKTLVVKLKQPTPYFLQIVCSSVAMPMNREFYAKQTLENGTNKYGEKLENILGNGPFIVKDWQHNKDILLEKNPKYWNAENIKLDEINFRIIFDNESAVVAFMSGELDIVEVSQAHKIDELKSKGFKVDSYNTGATQYILFNTEDKYLKNINLRKALTYGVERDRLVNEIVKDGSKEAYAFVNSVIRGADKSFREENGDIVRSDNTAEAESFALKSLVELKLRDLPKLTLLIDNMEASKRDAQALQEMWKKNLGIEVEIETAHSETIEERMGQKDYQMVLLRWASEYNDPASFLEIFESESHFNTSFNSFDYDNLMSRAREAWNEKERMNLLGEAEDMLFEHLHICPLYYVYSSYAVNPKVKGFVRRSNAIQDMDLYWTYIE